MKVFHKHSIKGIAFIISSLLIVLTLVPSFTFLMTHDLINWPVSSYLLIIQLLLSQIYFLFTQHDKPCAIPNAIILGLFEIFILICCLLIRDSLTLFTWGLLFIQWFLVHWVIITNQLAVILPIITLASQLLMMQNVFEFTQTQLFLTSFHIVPILFNLSIACFLALLFYEDKQGHSALLWISSWGLFLLWLISSLFFNYHSLKLTITMAICLVLILVIYQITQRKINK